MAEGKNSEHLNSLEAIAPEYKNEWVQSVNAIFKSLRVINNDDLVIKLNKETKNNISEKYYNTLTNAGFKLKADGSELRMHIKDLNKYCQTDAINLDNMEYKFLSTIQQMVPQVSNSRIQDLTPLFNLGGKSTNL